MTATLTPPKLSGPGKAARGARDEDVPPPTLDLSNIVARFEVCIMRGGRSFRRSFSDLAAAMEWRDEIVAQHPKAQAGRPTGPGRRWTQGRSRYHILRDHGICPSCKAVVTDGRVKCAECGGRADKLTS